MRQLLRLGGVVLRWALPIWRVFFFLWAGAIVQLRLIVLVWSFYNLGTENRGWLFRAFDLVELS